MSKTVIIFGAGASYDSIDVRLNTVVDRYIPPLTDMIFDRRFDGYINQFPRVQEIIGQIRRFLNDKKGTLEDYFTLLKNNVRTEFQQIQLIELYLYLATLFNGISHNYAPMSAVNTNYVALVRYIKEHELNNVDLISFNYDLLLDNAYRKVFNRKFNNIHDYISGPVKLFKVHGSVNWGYLESAWDIPNVNNAESSAFSTIFYKKISFEKLKTQPIEILRDDIYKPILDQGIKGDPFICFPAMIIPEPIGKDFIIEAYRSFLEDILKEATKIIVIGWRGGDKYFMDLISKSVPKKTCELYLIDYADGANQVRNNFKGINEWKQINCYKFGFSGLIGDPKLLDQIFA
jgi:hypothetical protein